MNSPLQFVPPKPKGKRAREAGKTASSTERGLAFRNRLKEQGGRVVKVPITAEDDEALQRVKAIGNYRDDAEAIRATIRAYYARVKRGAPVRKKWDAE